MTNAWPQGDSLILAYGSGPSSPNILNRVGLAILKEAVLILKKVLLIKKLNGPKIEKKILILFQAKIGQ